MIYKSNAPTIMVIPHNLLNINAENWNSNSQGLD